MASMDSPMPHVQELQDRLSLLLKREDSRHQLLQIERRPNPYSSAFPSEIVWCRFDDGSEQRLLLKYGREDRHTGHGFWRDMSYEARIYAEILQQLPGTAPKFYGAFPYDARGQTCLVLEYVEDTLRLSKAPDKTIVQVAGWLGRFHASSEDLARQKGLPPFLQVHDVVYYAGWARRASEYTRTLWKQYPWFREVCERFEVLMPLLLRDANTVIHGEFYPSNILVADQLILPVDWQASALARGEIDLASLLEGWDRLEIVQQCEEVYRQSRWPNGSPEDYHTALGIARLYWPLRWLGDEPKWALDRRRRWYFDHLRLEAEHLGLL